MLTRKRIARGARGLGISKEGRGGQGNHKYIVRTYVCMYARTYIKKSGGQGNYIDNMLHAHAYQEKRRPEHLDHGAGEPAALGPALHPVPHREAEHVRVLDRARHEVGRDLPRRDQWAVICRAVMTRS